MQISFDVIDSTNAEAMRRAGAGERGPLWLVAARQSAGRGRQGRNWASDVGNLHATLLISLPVAAVIAAQTSFVAALAVHDLAAGVLGAPGKLALKWPNDVLLDGAKLSGILIETVAQPATARSRAGGTPVDTHQPLWVPACAGTSADGDFTSSCTGTTTVAIGIGINLASAPEHTRYGATSLAAHGVHVEPDDAFRRLAAAMTARLAVWNDGAGFAVIRRDWTACAAGLGRLASVTMGERTVIGQITGLASDGALVIREAGGRLHAVHAGEVSLALEAS